MRLSPRKKAEPPYLRRFGFSRDVSLREFDLPGDGPWSAASDAHSAHFKTRGCRFLARNCSECLGIPRTEKRPNGFVLIGFRCGPFSRKKWATPSLEPLLLSQLKCIRP